MTDLPKMMNVADHELEEQTAKQLEVVKMPDPFKVVEVVPTSTGLIFNVTFSGTSSFTF